MEAATRCDGPSFWPADEYPASHGGTTSGGSSSDTSADSPRSRSAGARGPPDTPFALYAPAAAAQTHIHDLSAFLAASGAAGDHLPPSGAMSSTLLDELLGANDDMEQLPSARSMAVANAQGAAAGEDGVSGLLGMSARQAAALLGEPTGEPTGNPRTPIHATARLLQLEDNYERKKKRAKINRKDLNARFQELMELLHLREDRKLNRAKVLEKAIERIEQLSAELEAAKAQLGGTYCAPAASSNPFPAHSGVHKAATTMVPIALPARRVAGHAEASSTDALASLSCSSTASIMHPWGPASGSALPLTSMVWVPCPVVGHPMQASLALDATRDGSSAVLMRRRLKRTREESASESESSVDEEPPTQRQQPAADCASKGSAPPTAAVAVWAVHEIPTVMQFCDAWTLASVMQTCKELERVARREELWASLLQRRWLVASRGPERLPARQQWAAWHASNRMPDCSSITPEGFHFATGRMRNVNAWGLLSRRSNGRTTRTVLVSGRATVMQVVELYVVVQNMSDARVRLTDRIAMTAGDDRRPLASPFTADSGAHLTPHVVAFNAKLCTTAGVAGVTLHHGDLCVLSVFLHCEGLDLEDEFLRRAGELLVNVESQSPSGRAEGLEIRAQCHATSGQQHKRAVSS